MSTRPYLTAVETAETSVRAMSVDARHQTYDLAPILSVGEAASFLRLNRKTVYDAVAAREMPGRRIRNRVVIPRDALLEWLQGKDCVLPHKRKR